MTYVSGEKAQIFNDFLLVFSLLTMAALQSYLSVRVDTDICLTPITFTPSIVRRTIHKLKATLSSGIDGISNCFLESVLIVYACLYVIYLIPLSNLIQFLSSGILP